MHIQHLIAELAARGYSLITAVALPVTLVFVPLWQKLMSVPSGDRRNHPAALTIKKFVGRRSGGLAFAGPPIASQAVDEMVYRAVLWLRWRFWVVRLPLLSGLGCLLASIVIYVAFGHPPGSVGGQWRDKIEIFAVGYGWAAVVWAIPAACGEAAPNYLIAARILTLIRLVAGSPVRLTTTDLSWRVARLRRRIAQYLLVQHAVPGESLAGMNSAVQARLAAACDRIFVDREKGRDDLYQALWQALGVVAMSQRSIQAAVGDAANLPVPGFPDTSALRKQRFITLLPGATVVVVFLALVARIYAAGNSALIAAAIPAVIAAATALALAYVTPRSRS